MEINICHSHTFLFCFTVGAQTETSFEVVSYATER